jgi:hypothetical protein
LFLFFFFFFFLPFFLSFLFAGKEEVAGAGQVGIVNSKDLNELWEKAKEKGADLHKKIVGKASDWIEKGFDAVGASKKTRHSIGETSKFVAGSTMGAAAKGALEEMGDAWSLREQGPVSGRVYKGREAKLQGKRGVFLQSSAALGEVIALLSVGVPLRRALAEVADRMQGSSAANVAALLGKLASEWQFALFLKGKERREVMKQHIRGMWIRYLSFYKVRQSSLFFVRGPNRCSVSISKGEYHPPPQISFSLATRTIGKNSSNFTIRMALPS